MPHKNIYLRLIEPVNKNIDFYVTTKFLPEVRTICSNGIRASIMHLLINSPETLHSMQVEELAFKIGVRPRIIIYHLERLKEWGLVEVRKNKKHGNKNRRSIWGIDLKHPSWVMECYNSIITHFFDERKLNEFTRKNKSFRKNNNKQQNKI